MGGLLARFISERTVKLFPSNPGGDDATRTVWKTKPDGQARRCEFFREILMGFMCINL